MLLHMPSGTVGRQVRYTHHFLSHSSADYLRLILLQNTQNGALGNASLWDDLTHIHRSDTDIKTRR